MLRVTMLLRPAASARVGPRSLVTSVFDLSSKKEDRPQPPSAMAHWSSAKRGISTFSVGALRPQHSVMLTQTRRGKATTNEAQAAVDRAEPRLTDASADLASSAEKVLTTDSAADSLTTAVTQIDTNVLNGIARMGELREAGLGAFHTPVGLLQNFLEVMSAVPHIPMTYSIVAATVLIRLALTPVIVQSMRNNVKLANLKPEMELHTTRLKECKEAGDMVGAQEATVNLQQLFIKNDCHPLKSLKAMFIQGPLFISFFLAIRKMAEAHLDCFKHGGLLWFPDLSMPDPYYLLPVIATSTMLATILLGSDGNVMDKNQHIMRKFIIGLSICVLPITVAFPAGLFVYWIPSNIYSLCQLVFLRNDAVRTYFNIPKMIQHPPNPNAPKMDFSSLFKAGKESVSLQSEADKHNRVLEGTRKMKIPKK